MTYACYCKWTTLYPSKMATMGAIHDERPEALRISTNPDCPQHGTDRGDDA